MQLPLASGLPIPRPIAIVGGGPAAVMVTLTCPGVVTVNVWTFEEPGCTTPVNVSVVSVADGEVMDDELLLEPPHAAAADATTARLAATVRFVRPFILALRCARQAYNRHRAPCGDIA